MIVEDESDYVCSCNCDSLRGHVLKYIFNLHDLVMFFLSFICGWTHMRDKAINRTVHCEKWFIYGETYFLDTVILFNVYLPVRM